jgi:hypothetical protein
MVERASKGIGWESDMKHPSCGDGLDDRCRDANGEIRRKNGSTRIDTLRQTYGEEFAPGARGDMHLNTLLDRTDAGSLSDYLKHRQK